MGGQVTKHSSGDTTPGLDPRVDPGNPKSLKGTLSLLCTFHVGL